MRYHIPVLLNTIIENLITKKDGVYVDCTLGGGGHLLEMSKNLSDKAVLCAFDADSDAMKHFKNNIKTKINQKTILVNKNYLYLKPSLFQHGITSADGFLFDLGVSSYQLDNPEKGFTYRFDSKISMSFDKDNSEKGIELLNKGSLKEISNVLKKYGELKNAKKIADLIIKKRTNEKIETTFQLKKIITDNFNSPNINKFLSQVFQAFRIYVNNELENLETALEKAVEMLNTGGRIAVLSYHSLEDRITKNIFKKGFDPCTCPSDFPECVCGKKPYLKKVKKFFPYTPTENEIQNNIRAKSAKLRIVEKI